MTAKINMTFGDALEAMQAGHCVQRRGWNGKNMHLYLEKNLRRGFGTVGRRSHEPTICMFTAQGQYQPGWLASQADMLATDWQFASLRPALPAEGDTTESVTLRGDEVVDALQERVYNLEAKVFEQDKIHTTRIAALEDQFGEVEAERLAE